MFLPRRICDNPAARRRIQAGIARHRQAQNSLQFHLKWKKSASNNLLALKTRFSRRLEIRLVKGIQKFLSEFQ